MSVPVFAVDLNGLDHGLVGHLGLLEDDWYRRPVAVGEVVGTVNEDGDRFPALVTNVDDASGLVDLHLLPRVRWTLVAQQPDEKERTDGQ